MMRTLKTITLVATMLISVLGYADKRLIKDAVIDLDNVKAGQKLIVKTENGDIIHSETIVTNGHFSKVIDFEGMQDGHYSFELEKDFEILVTPFQIENREFYIDKEHTQKHFKPLVQNDYNTLKISQLSLSNAPVKIEIYYSDELIYSETIDKEQLIYRNFKLSKRNKGEYRSVVKANGRSFTYNFEF